MHQQAALRLLSKMSFALQWGIVAFAFHVSLWPRNLKLNCIRFLLRDRTFALYFKNELFLYSLYPLRCQIKECIDIDRFQFALLRRNPSKSSSYCCIPYRDPFWCC